MRVRLAAALIAFTATAPAAAQENPWTMIKGMFHEPVTELKQQLKQLRPPGKAKTAPKPSFVKREKPAVAPEPDNAPAPIPVARPAPQAVAPPESNVANTPPQGNSPILIDETTAATETIKADGSDVAAEKGLSTAVGDPRKVDTKSKETAAIKPSKSDFAANPVDISPDKLAPEAERAPEALAAPGAPIPRPRPEGALAYASVESNSPAAKSVASIGALGGRLPSLVKPPPAAGSTCGVALARLGVEAEAIDPIHDGVCGVPEPVAVAALGGGAVDLTARAIIRCQLAEVFANWLKGEAQPAAQKFLDGRVVGLRVAASYACRSRNNVAGAKLSEHARGNAIDISAFNVAGHGWVKVGGMHSVAETRFLKEVRKSACGPFKTVLGPGSDSYHSDHFHLDLAKRTNRGPSRGLYCK